MKTKEELNALKEEVEALSRKLRDLSEEELKQVSGGVNREWVSKVRAYMEYAKMDLNCSTEPSAERKEEMMRELEDICDLINSGSYAAACRKLYAAVCADYPENVKESLRHAYDLLL